MVIRTNNLEKEIATAIRNLDHKVVAGVEIAGLSADLLVDDKFVIEIGVKIWYSITINY